MPLAQSGCPSLACRPSLAVGRRRGSMGRRAMRPNGKAKAKRSLARTSAKDTAGKVRDLDKRLAEALEQQTATSEILRIISSSPSNVQPVFDAVAESAARLCESFDSAIWRQEGD